MTVQMQGPHEDSDARVDLISAHRGGDATSSRRLRCRHRPAQSTAREQRGGLRDRGPVRAGDVVGLDLQRGHRLHLRPLGQQERPAELPAVRLLGGPVDSNRASRGNGALREGTKLPLRAQVERATPRNTANDVPRCKNLYLWDCTRCPSRRPHDPSNTHNLLTDTLLSVCGRHRQRAHVQCTDDACARSRIPSQEDVASQESAHHRSTHNRKRRGKGPAGSTEGATTPRPLCAVFLTWLEWRSSRYPLTPLG